MGFSFNLQIPYSPPPPEHGYQVSDACSMDAVDENFIQNFRHEM
jgi:hypothetical protein